MRIRVVMCLVFALLVSACGNAMTSGTPGSASSSQNASVAATVGSIQVIDPWTRPAGAGTDKMGGMGGGANGAAYMKIKNTGSAPDRLLLAQSDVAKSVELHTMAMQGNVMQMRQVENIEVPANGEVELKPGSFHVMLIGLTREMKIDDTVTFKLQFEKAGAVEIKAKVRQP